MPTFLLPPLSLANAIGICGIVSLLQLGQTVAIVWPQVRAKLLRDPASKFTEEDWDKYGGLMQSLMNVFLFYPMALLIAWIVSLFL